ncbi:unnamed protein product [Rotaria socialis]|uniref:Uncharacterized protein n=2 Tax=Rotaria socialis TaxID=392032 RepID=A0A820NZL4_9BILA|nr:unnamed protein product [Rotaria socialis]
MRSSYDTYSSSTSNSTYRSPSSHLDFTPISHGSDRAEFHDRYQNRYAWLEKNHVNDVGSQYKSLGKQVDHKPSTWRCEDQAEAGKEFLRINDECADKIYDIRERSDISREFLLNSDGVATRFYQLEADALKNRYELNNMKRKLDGIKQLRARRHIVLTMNCSSSMKDRIELVDLSDELILIIMNKVKPKVLLLCSIITVGNNRLEELALDKCHSIDLTFDYFRSPYQNLIQRFYSHVLPCIINNVQSLTLNIQHIPNISTFAERNSNEILPNLTHLKIMMGRKRSITGTPYILEIDTLRQSFIKHQQQSVDCVIDYFSDKYDQCQIYSLPFIGTRLDFISNRFPLFDTNRTFAMVTKSLLFDDIQPFESDFFEHVSQALPQLRTLDVLNGLEQQEKIKTTTNNLEFTNLITRVLFDIHLDYAKQLLCRTHRPCLVELAIDNDILLKIITQDQQQTKDNCSRVETLRTWKPLYHSADVLQDFSTVFLCQTSGRRKDEKSMIYVKVSTISFITIFLRVN